MRVAVAAAALIVSGLLSCTREEAHRPWSAEWVQARPPISVEQEANLVLECLQDGYGSGAGAPYAVDLRSEALKALVFDWGEDRGLELSPPAAFGVTARKRYVFEAPRWGEGGIVELPFRVEGEGELLYTAMLVPQTRVFDLIGYVRHDHIEDWEPLSLASEEESR